MQARHGHSAMTLLCATFHSDINIHIPLSTSLCISSNPVVLTLKNLWLAEKIHSETLAAHHTAIQPLHSCSSFHGGVVVHNSTLRTDKKPWWCILMVLEASLFISRCTIWMHVMKKMSSTRVHTRSLCVICASPWSFPAFVMREW